MDEGVLSPNKVKDETGRYFLQMGYFIKLFKKQSIKKYAFDLKNN